MSRAIHLVAGALVEGDGVDAARFSPVSGDMIAAANLASVDQGRQAAKAADDAAGAVAALDIAERAAALRTLADLLDGDAQPIADLVTLENGCPRAQSAGLQVGSATSLLRAYADLADAHRFEERRAGLRGGHTIVLRQPVGPALGIVPWNVPLFLACMKLAPAIVAGCPVVLKPSPESADSMGRFAVSLAKLELPPGAVQSVVAGADVGRTMVADARFAKIAFTGSTNAGRAVGMAAMERFARVTLELGGKSAAILLDDVDPNALPAEFWLAVLQNNGQVCGAQSRILIPQSRAKDYEDAIAAMFDALVVGDPRDDTTQVGPVVSPNAASRINDAVDADIAEGGRLLTRWSTPAAIGYEHRTGRPHAHPSIAP